MMFSCNGFAPSEAACQLCGGAAAAAPVLIIEQSSEEQRRVM